MNFNIFSRTQKKKYGHIVSLGYNCEVSFQFFLKYHFVESSLFAWVNTINCSNLISALNHLDIIGTQGFKKIPPMYQDIASGLSFHAQKGEEVSEEKIQEELISRIQYLKQKFKKTAQDGKKNLYIFKYPPSNFSSDQASGEILDLYSVLSKIVQNDFDLLIISEKKNTLNFPIEIKNLFVRYVNFFTPEEAVTSKPYDQKSFQKIFEEFQPDFRLPKRKKFKFEDIDK